MATLQSVDRKPAGTGAPVPARPAGSPQRAATSRSSLSNKVSTLLAAKVAADEVDLSKGTVSLPAPVVEAVPDGGELNVKARLPGLAEGELKLHRRGDHFYSLRDEGILLAHPALAAFNSVTPTVLVLRVADDTVTGWVGVGAPGPVRGTPRSLFDAMTKAGDLLGWAGLSEITIPTFHNQFANGVLASRKSRPHCPNHSARPSGPITGDNMANLVSANGQPSRLSFEQFIDHVLAHAEPLSQNTGEHDLGFGWLYYAFIRNVRPNAVIAIGSRRGFMPFCATRAVLDNGIGKVFFIDPSYSGYGHPGWSGGGFWSDPADVAARIEAHGLTEWIEHVRLESADAFPMLRARIGAPKPGIVIIDGAHTHENSLQDFDLYSSLFSEGFVLFHDATAPGTGVPQTIRELRDRGVPHLTVHRDVGLAIAEIPPRKPVSESWGYLCDPSDRHRRIADIVKPLLRDDDAVMDAYCGAAPVAPLLRCGSVFGFDGDPDCIGQLHTHYPQHTFRVIEERAMPFARDLPNDIDVLLGLGISHGYAWWDPQQAVNNLYYLIGRYVPRVCVLETAADYHDASILRDLKPSMERLGYQCHYDWFDTDLASYARRKILIASRGFV